MKLLRFEVLSRDVPEAAALRKCGELQIIHILTGLADTSSRYRGSQKRLPLDPSVSTIGCADCDSPRERRGDDVARERAFVSSDSNAFAEGHGSSGVGGDTLAGNDDAHEIQWIGGGNGGCFA